MIDVTQVAEPAAFAAANGMQFEAAGQHPSFGGAVFEYLQQNSTSDEFRSTSGRIFEVGAITGRVGGSPAHTRAPLQSIGWVA